jgi:hypothetical protein
VARPFNARAEQLLINNRGRKSTKNSPSSSLNPSRNTSSAPRGRKRTATTSASASNPNSKRTTPNPSRASSPHVIVPEGSVYMVKTKTIRKLEQPGRTTSQPSPERRFQVAISPPKAGITAADNALINARLEEGDNYVPGTIPSEGYRRPAWRAAQDAKPYADGVFIATKGTQEQPIMVDDSDSDQGAGGEDENDGFVDIDDVIPDSPSAVVITRRTGSQPRLETQDMFPNEPGIRALIIATDSQRAALVNTQVFEDIMSTLGHGVNKTDESTDSEC